MKRNYQLIIWINGKSDNMVKGSHMHLTDEEFEGNIKLLKSLVTCKGDQYLSQDIVYPYLGEMFISSKVIKKSVFFLREVD